MKQVEVQIMGQGYLLGCPDGGHTRLMAAVDRVDDAMCRIRDAGKVKARDRIAVLAALNLAFDLTDQETVPAPPPPAPVVLPPVAPAPVAAVVPATSVAAATPGLDAEAADILALIERLDRVLSGDGRLI